MKSKKEQIEKLKKSGTIILNEQGKGELILKEGVKIGDILPEITKESYKCSEITSSYNQEGDLVIKGIHNNRVPPKVSYKVSKSEHVIGNFKAKKSKVK